mgnify:CR=1 FL=1
MMAGKNRYRTAFQKVVLSVFLSLLPLHAGVSDAAIQRTIQQYNLGVIEAAKTGKVHQLYPYAKEEVVTKSYVWVMSWQENNLYMQAKIDSFAFKKIEVDKKHAKVTTNEVWTYRYYDAKNKKTAWPETRITYETEYLLFLHNRRWMIEKVTVISEKQEKL